MIYRLSKYYFSIYRLIVDYQNCWLIISAQHGFVVYMNQQNIQINYRFLPVWLTNTCTLNLYDNHFFSTQLTFINFDSCQTTHRLTLYMYRSLLHKHSCSWRSQHFYYTAATCKCHCIFFFSLILVMNIFKMFFWFENVKLWQQFSVHLKCAINK